MADQNNALIVGIAQIIDYPSVYMGGPSRNSLRIAETIVKEFGADIASADRAAPDLLDEVIARRATEADLRAEVDRLTYEVKRLREALYDVCFEYDPSDTCQNAMVMRDIARSALYPETDGV